MKSSVQKLHARRLHAFYDAHAKLINGLSNVFSIATGLAWFASLVPGSPNWAWPAAATLAALALALTLIRVFDLSQKREQNLRAFDELVDVTHAMIIDRLGHSFARMQASGDVPVTHLASLLTTARSYSAMPEKFDRLLDALHEYERNRG
jgi:hypothetical protein